MAKAPARPGESTSAPLFKEMTQLTKQKEELDACWWWVSPLQRQELREDRHMLDSYIPNVARMKDQLRKST